REAPTVDALRARDFGRLFRLLTLRGATQGRIGIETDLSQGQVSQIINGSRRVTQLEVIERIASGLRMPDHARLAIGLAPTSVTSELAGASAGKDRDVRRREFLRGAIRSGAAVAGAAAALNASGGAPNVVTPAGRRPDRSTAGHLAGL